MQTTAITVAKDTVAGHNPILYCSISILSISAVYEKFGCSVSNPLNLQMHLSITYVTSLLCFQKALDSSPGIVMSLSDETANNTRLMNTLHLPILDTHLSLL